MHEDRGELQGLFLCSSQSIAVAALDPAMMEECWTLNTKYPVAHIRNVKVINTIKTNRHALKHIFLIV